MGETRTMTAYARNASVIVPKIGAMTKADSRCVRLALAGNGKKIRAAVSAPKMVVQMTGSIAINRRPKSPRRTMRRSALVHDRRTSEGSRSKPSAMRSVSALSQALLGWIVFSFLIWVGPLSAHELSLRGLILATIPTDGTVVVRRDASPALAAGIATYRVEPRSALRTLRAGMSIEATLQSDTKPPTLAGVHAHGLQALTGEAPPARNATTPKIFRNVHHVIVGEYAPVARLVDQAGKPFSLRDLRGQSVVMAFVYTRCRDARECPLIASRFRLLQERFRGAPVHLVLVTLDPVYDTPTRLAAYGRTFGVDARRWTLATGDPERVLDFAAQFDVTAFPDERIGLIHPERTVIVDPFGAIRELVDEGAWTPDEIVAAVRHDARLGSNPIERLDLFLSSAAVSICGNGVAGFSGFVDLLTVIAIASFFGLVFWRVGRGIARGTT